MQFLGFLLIGLVAGWVTGHIMKGGGYGLFGNLIVGVIGSFVGGFVYGLFGWSSRPYGIFGSFLMAVVGAVVFVAVLRLIRSHGGGKNRQEEKS